MADKFETFVQKLVHDRKIPNAIFYASDAAGDFQYHKVFGYVGPEPGAPPFTEATYMRSASCTKIVTAISIMKLVEQGQLELDTVVYDVLPELGGLKILTKKELPFEYATPKNKITFRQLLLHTSGLGYDFMPGLTAWARANRPQGTSVPQRFKTPLLFEPGTAWCYGCGLDWAGLAVERMSGGKLSVLMETNIFRPLGLEKDALTFFPLEVPGAKLATMAKLDADGSLVAAEAEMGCQELPETDCWGGQGLHLRGSGSEYIKILRSLLADEKLLQRATVSELLRPQLEEPLRKSMNDLVFSVPQLTRVMSREIEQGKLDWSFGGVVDKEGKTGWRGKGTVMWGGTPNLNWFLDCEQGLCGFQGTQFMPAGEQVFVDVERSFEKTMSELAGKPM